MTSFVFTVTMILNHCDNKARKQNNVTGWLILMIVVYYMMSVVAIVTMNISLSWLPFWTVPIFSRLLHHPLIIRPQLRQSRGEGIRLNGTANIPSSRMYSNSNMVEKKFHSMSSWSYPKITRQTSNITFWIHHWILYIQHHILTNNTFSTTYSACTIDNVIGIVRFRNTLGNQHYSRLNILDVQ